MKPRVLIIGSSGMFGCDLCQELSRKYEVYCADVAVSRQLSAIRFSKCDITNKKSISDAVAKIRPDVVIHTAAWTDVDGCEKDPRKAYRINRDGTRNVAIACRAVGAALVYISTDFVFSGRKKAPYKESDIPAPLGVYADSKLAGERAVKSILKNYFIIRTSWLYGKCGKNFVDTIIAKAKQTPALKVVDDQIGSPTYTRDLAKAIHMLLDRFFTGYGLWVTGYGTYHISNSGSASWYDYARAILQISNLRTKIEPISSVELARPAKRPAMSVLDCSKFTKFTGSRMRKWKDALEEYLER